MTKSESPSPDLDDRSLKVKNYARGAAPASGLNFQATVTSIAAVHLLDGSRISWLDELAEDRPSAIRAETGGPGDDICVELASATMEIQVKRGLAADENLWKAMLDLAQGLASNKIAFGVLAVSPDSSRTVTRDLEQDLRHIGSGRSDRLHAIGRRWIERLGALHLDAATISRSLRIQTIAGSDGNGDAIRAAKTILAGVCGSVAAADRAWQALLDGAHGLIARKGRWDQLALIRLLSAANVPIGMSNTPARLVRRSIDWALESNRTFSVFGADRPVDLDTGWIKLSARLNTPAEMPADPAAAMALYRSPEVPAGQRQKDDLFDAEFLGRFKRKIVVVAGPGLGKSTLLRRLAQRYARDDFPVLKVQLRKVSASLEAGETLETAIRRQGLDGSGIEAAAIANIGSDGWVLLADGLDECGRAQEDVAEGLHRFSVGHPACRIIVTTRPIGYETKLLANWPHYELTRPDSGAAAAHVEMLIGAIAPPGGTQDKKTAQAAAKTEFDYRKPTSAIAADPQLLGTAASLLLRGEQLGRSRVELFQRLFSSIECSAERQSSGGDVDLGFCHAVLDRIGWWLTEKPLDAYHAILANVTADLAALLEMPTLTVGRQVREATRFWERMGVIERIHHRDTFLLAFVHKSFGEYAAARCLAAMGKTVCEQHIARIASLPGWAEVLTFAAGLGIGSPITEALIAAGELTRSIAVASDPAVDLPGIDIELIAEPAFADLKAGAPQLEVGSALVALAARHPTIIGPRLGTYFDHADEDVRRIAWACAVAAGPEYHDPDLAAKRAIEMVARESPAMQTSLLGGYRLMRTERLEIAEGMALTNLELLKKRWARGDIEAHVASLLSEDSATRVGFFQRVAAIVEPLAIKPRIAMKPYNSLGEIFAPDSAYSRAQIAAADGLFAAIESAIGEVEVASVTLDLALHPALELSGLIRIIRLWDAPADEVWAWTQPHERDAVVEGLRIIIALSGLDAARLAQEVATIRRRIADEPQTRFFQALEDVYNVDIDDPKWQRLADVTPDLDLIERGLAHTSTWVVQVATTVLAKARTRREDVARLLAGASGLGFAAGASLAMQLGEPEGSTLIIERLEGEPRDGIRHLFGPLGSTGIGWTPQVAKVAAKYLLSSSPASAAACAGFILAQIEAGMEPDADLLRRAYAHWQVHEPRKNKDGSIPATPRDNLFKALLARNAVSDEMLVAATQDDRHDIRSQASDRLIARAGEDANVVRLIGEHIKSGAIEPNFTRQFLRANIPLDPVAIDAIVGRLDDSTPRWRLAATGILGRDYLEADRVRRFAEKLSRDEHPEIRDAVAQWYRTPVHSSKQ